MAKTKFENKNTKTFAKRINNELKKKTKQN